MGGIRGASQSALKKNSSLFPTNTDFLLFLVTEEDYIANINNLDALKQIPFGQVYCYYNADTPNAYVYEISSHMGGECKLLVANMTPYNVELREGGLYEPAIGYVGSMDIGKIFPLETAEYIIYPVFRKFDKKTAEILSSFPKYAGTGNNVVEIFGFDNETTEHEFDASVWIRNNDFKFSPSCAYLQICNGSQVEISLYEGNSTPLLTTSGYSVINPSKTRMFDIQMTKTGQAQYKDSTIKSTYRYGDATIGKYDIPENEYIAGYLYTFNVKQQDGTNNPRKLQGDFEMDGEVVKATKYEIDD
ncbi:MAG: hypothetical protein K6E78_08970 [Treponema sp.]|nr:hypothetical protein [Treponema sp.]